MSLLILQLFAPLIFKIKDLTVRKAKIPGEKTVILPQGIPIENPSLSQVGIPASVEMTPIITPNPTSTEELHPSSGMQETTSFSETFSATDATLTDIVTSNIVETEETSEHSQIATPSETFEPIKVPEPTNSPENSQIQKATQTQEPSQTANPSQTIEPTQATELSQTQESAQTEEISQSLELSKTTEYSQTTEPSPTYEPTHTTEFSPTPEPSHSIELSQTPEPSLAPETTKAFEPSKNPEPKITKAKPSFSFIDYKNAVERFLQSDSTLEKSEDPEFQQKITQLKQNKLLVFKPENHTSLPCTYVLAPNRHGKFFAKSVSFIFREKVSSDMAILIESSDAATTFYLQPKIIVHSGFVGDMTSPFQFDLQFNEISITFDGAAGSTSYLPEIGVFGYQRY